MKRKSINQFKKDFIIFPFPGMGKTDFADFKFDICYTAIGKFKAIIVNLPIIIINYWHVTLLGREYLKPLKELELSISSVRDSISEAIIKSNYIRNNNKFVWLIFLTFASLMMLLAIPILFAHFIFSVIKVFTVIIKQLIKGIFVEENVLGHVSPVKGNLIFINNKGCKREERTISHEHMHLVQYSRGDLAEVIYENKTNLERLLLSNNPSPHELYLFSKLELEVRLHEFIRFNYHNNGKVPMSRDEFYNEVRCFMNNEHDEDVLGSDIIKMSNVISISAYEFCRNKNGYIELDERTFKEFLDIENKMLDKFVLEILFVSYIKLMRYYGYGDLSKKLGSEVMFPNLYNFTYSS